MGAEGSFYDLILTVARGRAGHWLGYRATGGRGWGRRRCDGLSWRRAQRASIGSIGLGGDGLRAGLFSLDEAMTLPIVGDCIAEVDAA